jgi:hypothetical protein
MSKSKLKNILSEIEWKGMNVELGKVYTFKDIPPFKTPQQIKEEEEAAKPALTEASEVKFTELTPIQQKQIQAFEKVIGGKHSTIWDGIHGMIVDIDKKSFTGGYRFDVDTMKKLISLKIRWVEGDKDNVSIGF